MEKFWIYFADKGATLSKSDWNKLSESLNPRAAARRQKVGDLLNITDVPVYAPYVRALREHQLNPIVISKWLNAVSVYATIEQVDAITDLPFVKSIQRVAQGSRPLLPLNNEQLMKSSAVHVTSALDYGPSIEQNALIHIPELHTLGVTGEGALIAILDTGFSLKHPALANVHIKAAYDFINQDEQVDNEEDDPLNENDHGTKVLSIIGAFSPGNLIGTAYDAEFLLAKTEYIAGETQVEEDYWIAAAEWADSLGADVINSSLGYTDWYTYEDMNGLTAPITLAADLAFQKGIVVVTSAGNEGDDAWYYVSAPADGFDVIAVGAVRSDSLIASFSSRGPTSDGRIKPDVVAMGVSTVYSNSNGVGFGRGSGTSYSSPQVAGVAALILSAHPELTPKQVREALIKTANRVNSPNNVYGFGLVNALAAVNYWGAVSEPGEQNRFVQSYPNPFSYELHSQILFIVDLKEANRITIDLFNVLGQKVTTIVDVIQPALSNIQVTWQGLTADGSRLPSGLYFFRARIGDAVHMGKVTILQ